MVQGTYYKNECHGLSKFTKLYQDKLIGTFIDLSPYQINRTAEFKHGNPHGKSTDHYQR